MDQTPSGAVPAGGEARCDDCGLPYVDDGFCDLTVANEVWAKISPTGDEGGLLCPSCMVRAGMRAGIKNARATFVSGPFAGAHDPMSTPILERAADTLRGYNKDEPWRVAGTLLRLRDELADALAARPPVPAEDAAKDAERAMRDFADLRGWGAARPPVADVVQRPAPKGPIEAQLATWTVEDWRAYAHGIEKPCLQLTHDMDEHPEDYDGPCDCLTCRQCES